jgi:hypothetical protein
MRRLRPHPSPDTRIDQLVGYLEKQLRVRTDANGTLTIKVRWPQPEAAARIVESAYRFFLEGRHATEMAVIGESIAILESHANRAQADVHEAAEALREAREARSPRRAGARRPATREPQAKAEDPAVAELRTVLATTRRAIDDLEESRRRRIADLQVQLTQQLTTYGPFHPALLGTQESLRLLSAESPQVAALKRKERELQDALSQHQTRGEEVARANRAAVVDARAMTYERPDEPIEDVVVEQARRKLVIQLDRYDNMEARIEAARMEQDIARAAFKYRYSVIRPAQVPRKPVSPNVPRTMVVGVFLGLALAVVGSAGRDLLADRIVAPWQLQRELGVPSITPPDP